MQVRGERNTSCPTVSMQAGALVEAPEYWYRIGTVDHEVSTEHHTDTPSRARNKLEISIGRENYVENSIEIPVECKNSMENSVDKLSVIPIVPSFVWRQPPIHFLREARTEFSMKSSNSPEDLIGCETHDPPAPLNLQQLTDALPGASKKTIRAGKTVEAGSVPKPNTVAKKAPSKKNAAGPKDHSKDRDLRYLPYALPFSCQ
ncbi:hypothetical protein RF11_13532 [Thelohanellus kitauei]|uniref:Uncharacterized protein n=1 Tax=Thelohanellus kitauei TaxID=669202 RepID=A0A0C2N5A6_THEKT|nr:hypothetical protein RF11_13532 [Thelohanellus kitauei]